MTSQNDTTADFVSMGNRPSLYLVYLIFLFLPWLFMPFSTVDVMAGLVAVCVFVPLHYVGFNAQGRRRLWSIAALALVSIATAPFALGHSVFTIYAVASASFARPLRTSAIILALCIVVYAASAWYFDRHPLEIVTVLLMSIVIWVSCLSSAEDMYEKERTERTRALDVQQASLIERERIARDLHDLLGHTLTLVSLKVDLAQRLMDNNPNQARTELDSIQVTSRKALSDVRAALSGLTATSIAQELANARIAMEAAGVTLTVSGAVPDLDPEQNTAFGLMLREAVTNIIRHSSASAANIQFDREDDVRTLSVTDNGDVSDISEGSGLMGLRARLEGLGGMVSVNTDAGMQLRALLPS